MQLGGYGSRIYERLLNFLPKNGFPGLIERDLNIKPIERKAITIIGPRRAGKTFYFF
ncbi:MAG: hypothetical protein QXS74_00125 [Nitrososphaeria archaeon]